MFRDRGIGIKAERSSSQILYNQHDLDSESTILLSTDLKYYPVLPCCCDHLFELATYFQLNIAIIIRVQNQNQVYFITPPNV